MSRSFNPRPLSRADDDVGVCLAVLHQLFQSASALASGRCSSSGSGWSIIGFNPRPLSRADDECGFNACVLVEVSIRVRSRERTITTVVASLASAMLFQSASALASGRSMRDWIRGSTANVSIRVRSRERTIELASAAALRIASFNPRPLSRADDRRSCLRTS